MKKFLVLAAMSAGMLMAGDVQTAEAGGRRGGFGLSIGSSPFGNSFGLSVGRGGFNRGIGGFNRGIGGFNRGIGYGGFGGRSFNRGFSGVRSVSVGFAQPVYSSGYYGGGFAQPVYSGGYYGGGGYCPNRGW